MERGREAASKTMILSRSIWVIWSVDLRVHIQLIILSLIFAYIYGNQQVRNMRTAILRAKLRWKHIYLCELDIHTWLHAGMYAWIYVLCMQPCCRACAFSYLECIGRQDVFPFYHVPGSEGLSCVRTYKCMVIDAWHDSHNWGKSAVYVTPVAEVLMYILLNLDICLSVCVLSVQAAGGSCGTGLGP